MSTLSKETLVQLFVNQYMAEFWLRETLHQRNQFGSNCSPDYGFPRVWFAQEMRCIAARLMSHFCQILLGLQGNSVIWKNTLIFSWLSMLNSSKDSTVCEWYKYGKRQNSV